MTKDDIWSMDGIYMTEFGYQTEEEVELLLLEINAGVI